MGQKMSAEIAIRRPSELLPRGLVGKLSDAWETIGDYAGWPARKIGFDVRVGGWRQWLRYVALSLPLLPSLLAGSLPAQITLFDAWGIGNEAGQLLSFIQDPILSVTLLTFQLLVTFSLNREWSRNERLRERYAALLEPKRADDLPDLRWVALFSSLTLILLLPLWLRSINVAACSYGGECWYSGGSSLLDWINYCLAAAVANVVPIVAYDKVRELVLAATLPKYLVLASLNSVLLFSIFEIARIRKVTEIAVDSLMESEKRAVAVGSRILSVLTRIITIDENDDLNSSFYRNAAVAMGQIGSLKSVHVLMRLASTASQWFVRLRAIEALVMLRDQSDSASIKSEIDTFLRQRETEERADRVLQRIRAALA